VVKRLPDKPAFDDFIGPRCQAIAPVEFSDSRAVMRCVRPAERNPLAWHRHYGMSSDNGENIKWWEW
jgi:hypothetical protein